MLQREGWDVCFHRALKILTKIKTWMQNYNPTFPVSSVVAKQIIPSMDVTVDDFPAKTDLPNMPKGIANNPAE